MRDPSVYKPPFCTETDEPVHDDCVAATMVMLVSAWTLGQATDQPTGPIMTPRMMKRLRERMRDRLGPGKQSGGLTPTDAEAMVAGEWPVLSGLRTPVLRWMDVWANLQRGSAVALWGDPSQVRKPDSPLRRFTIDDTFGHCLLVLRARAGRGFVMDPLGSGRYRGQWVEEQQIKRYAYMDPGERVRSMAIVTIGGESL